MSPQSPGNRFISHTANLDAADPILLDVLALWQSVRNGRSMPARQDMTPQLLRRHLGWVHIFDVVQEPLDFRFRLYGSRIAEVLGVDATGKLLTEAFSGPFLNSLFPAFEALVREKRPLLLQSSGAGADKEFLPITSMMLPLSDDDERVDAILLRHLVGGLDD